jgi:hypothetical protein
MSMARETKEQKELRRAAEEHAALIEKEAFVASLPKRIFEAQCVASMIHGVTVSMSMTATGPSVRFHGGQLNDSDPYLDATLTYQSDEWEVISLEDSLKKMKADVDAKEVRRKRAQEIFNGLSVEDREAVKEHIYSLR